MVECNPYQVPMEPRLKLSKESTSPLVDATLYKSFVECLMYLVHTRLELAFSIGYISRFMEEKREQHFVAVKHILRYIAKTKSWGVLCKKTKSTASSNRVQ